MTIIHFSDSGRHAPERKKEIMGGMAFNRVFLMPGLGLFWELFKAATQVAAAERPLRFKRLHVSEDAAREAAVDPCSNLHEMSYASHAFDVTSCVEFRLRLHLNEEPLEERFEKHRQKQ